MFKSTQTDVMLKQILNNYLYPPIVNYNQYLQIKIH
jgi:hypothetical protein